MRIDQIRNTVICGNSIDVLKELPDCSVNCVVTSPPYWGLRDYGVEGQLGLEKTPEEFIVKLVAIFREVRRVLRDDGTCWVNLGDSYAGGGRGCDTPKQQTNRGTQNMPKSIVPDGLKPKDLVGVPWRFALAAQADGWYLRQDIIWHKPNPMPESVTDRCTKSHEYIFLLTKSGRYWYDVEAIKEDAVETNDARPRMGQGPNTQYNQKRKNHFRNSSHYVNQGAGCSNDNHDGNVGGTVESSGKRNKRTVWTIPTQAYSEAHFATFPEKLIEPCILAGCPKEVCPKCGKARVRITESEKQPDHQERGQSYITKLTGERGSTKSIDNPDKMKAYNEKYVNNISTIGWSDCGCGVGFVPGIVLEPFCGSGTTCAVAAYNQRDYIGIELNPKYIEMAKRRIGEAETGVSVSEQKAGQGVLF